MTKLNTLITDDSRQVRFCLNNACYSRSREFKISLLPEAQDMVKEFEENKGNLKTLKDRLIKHGLEAVFTRDDGTEFNYIFNPEKKAFKQAKSGAWSTLNKLIATFLYNKATYKDLSKKYGYNSKEYLLGKAKAELIAKKSFIKAYKEYVEVKDEIKEDKQYLNEYLFNNTPESIGNSSIHFGSKDSFTTFETPLDKYDEEYDYRDRIIHCCPHCGSEDIILSRQTHDLNKDSIGTVDKSHECAYQSNNFLYMSNVVVIDHEAYIDKDGEAVGFDEHLINPNLVDDYHERCDERRKFDYALKKESEREQATARIENTYKDSLHCIEL